MVEPLTVSQRDRMYWGGFALFLLGVLLFFAGIRPAGNLIALGFGIAALGTFLALYTIFKTAGVAVVTGYREGKNSGR